MTGEQLGAECLLLTNDWYSDGTVMMEKSDATHELMMEKSDEKYKLMLEKSAIDNLA